MGLQTWNSVRALDFLAALPDVDKSRLAITGESGGGTQTMMLGAIDDRLAAVGPCVMVSHSMQGGCLCENAPGLRVDYSNMEIAAVAAPKPQIMVGATGDWTRTMMTDRRAGGARASTTSTHQPDKLKYVIFPFNHNINKTSRDAVYQFFGKTLLHDPSADSFHRAALQAWSRSPTCAFFPTTRPCPPTPRPPIRLTQYLKELGQTQLEKAKPRDKRSLTQFKKVYQTAWERTLNVETPDKEAFIVHSETKTRFHDTSGKAQATCLRSYIGRKGRRDSIPLLQFMPDHPQMHKTRMQIAVLVHPQGHAAFMENAQNPGPLVCALLAKGGHRSAARSLPEQANGRMKRRWQRAAKY